MHQIPLRRRFFVTAGLLTGGAMSLPLSQLLVAQRAQPDDDLLDHVGRVSARLYKQLKTGGFRSEHLHSLASNLRLFALVPGLDDLSRALVRRAHNHHGDTSPKRNEEVRKRLGIDISGEPPLHVTEAARVQIAREGLTRTLLAIAVQLDAEAETLAKRGDPPLHFRQVQGQFGWCGMVMVLETIAASACLVGGPANAVCLRATASYLALRWAMYWNGQTC